MFGIDTNLKVDDLMCKIEDIKARTEFSKEYDAVRVKYLDPSLAHDQTLLNLLDPVKINAVNAVMPFRASIPDMVVECFDGGMRIRTSDPDAVLALIDQLLRPDFLANMVKQATDTIARNKALLDQIGRTRGGTRGPDPDDYDEELSKGDGED
ncbi:MAG: hypothetical protein GYA24_20780 [Candidatus Lokiarchaeota archaeon]|nr:hypothetical protein [Candidatus Lokiarchaeota archaeon]